MPAGIQIDVIKEQATYIKGSVKGAGGNI